ncbi:MAG: hypothetical protein WCI12_07070, partial [Actinomycetes bacterium]
MLALPHPPRRLVRAALALALSSSSLLAATQATGQIPAGAKSLANAPTPPGGPGSSIIGSVVGNPTSVAVSSSGRIFETRGNALVSMAADGSDRRILVSSLLQPRGVAVDNSGNVFVADTGHNKIVRMDADGLNQTRIGADLLSPYGVAVDNSGNVFVADTGHN